MLFMPVLTMAATSDVPGFLPDDPDAGTFDPGLGDAPPYEVAARIINVALGLLGIVALILIIWGGFIWMSARGNEEQVSKAKKILESAVIGLVIILASFGISQYVFENLVNVTQ